MDAKIVGQKIAKYRKEKNMTQQQLADELLVSNKAISKWETGAGLPDIAILPTLATELGVSVDDLVFEGVFSSSSKHQNVFRRYISKPAVLMSFFVIISIVFLTMVFVFGLSNNPEWSDFIYLHEFSEVLEERGLQFINGSLYPHTTDWIDWVNPHIGRISEDIPVRLTTKYDVDLLLAIYRITYEMQSVGLSWDSSIDITISEAGLDDYLMNGIREITNHAREQQLIYLATEHTFEELVEWGIFTRPGIMKDFHELGFFLDLPEDFETSIDDLNLNGVMVVQAYYIPWEMPWITNGEIPEGIVPASPYNLELMVEVIGYVFTVTVFGDINRPIVYDIPLIIPDDTIPFNTEKRTVVTDGTLIYVINDDVEHLNLTDGTIRISRMIDIYDLSQVNIWYGTVRAWSEGDFSDIDSSGLRFDSYVVERNDFYELEVIGRGINNSTIPASMILSISLNTETNMTFTNTINLGL